jgi:hypothetical protein
MMIIAVKSRKKGWLGMFVIRKILRLNTASKLIVSCNFDSLSGPLLVVPTTKTEINLTNYREMLLGLGTAQEFTIMAFCCSNDQNIFFFFFFHL